MEARPLQRPGSGSSVSIAALTGLILFSAGIICFQYLHLRPDLSGPAEFSQFLLPGGLFIFLHLVYFYLAGAGIRENMYKPAMYLGAALRVALIFSLPNLSDDFYRFVWDGRLFHEGINPFALRPSELWDALGPDFQARMADLYPHLNSADYYSVYPSLLQGIFAGATTIFPTSLFGAIVVMKTVLVAAEIGSLWLLHRLSRRWKAGFRAPLFYALSPLVLIEISGNLHFEGLMIFFLLLCIYLLGRRRVVAPALSLAFAAGAKLLPLMLLPFLHRRLDPVRWVAFCLLTLAATLGLLLIFLPPEFIPHYRESLQLYFSNFAFNGGIYYGLATFVSYPDLFLLHRYLPVLTLLVLLFAAWKDVRKDWPAFADMALLALSIYQLLSPVVHPWYLAPLIALGALRGMYFPMVWGFFALLTYQAYYHPQVQESSLLIWLEYICVLSFMAYEYGLKRQGRSLEEFIYSRPLLRGLVRRSIPARVKIKLGHILPHLPKKAPVLDVGTGNGGLCAALLENGIAVEPVDVKDISFFPFVRPRLYDGKRLPYATGSFDTVMLITVLHHTPDPDAVLGEAARVAARRMVVMEDIYRNPFQKYLTYFTDSLVNLEFAGHPHTNRSDAEWRATFARMGWKVVAAEYRRTLVFFRQVVYVLERELNADNP